MLGRGGGPPLPTYRIPCGRSTTTSPTPGAGWSAVRQNSPAVTRAGMPCSASAWRTAVGLIICPRPRVSVVEPSGSATTENAASWTSVAWCGGAGLACGAGPAEPQPPARATTSAAHAATPAMDIPARRRRRRARPLAVMASRRGAVGMGNPEIESRTALSTALSFSSSLSFISRPPWPDKGKFVAQRADRPGQVHPNRGGGDPQLPGDGVDVQVEEYAQRDHLALAVRQMP